MLNLLKIQPNTHIKPPWHNDYELNDLNNQTYYNEQQHNPGRTRLLITRCIFFLFLSQDEDRD